MSGKWWVSLVHSQYTNEKDRYYDNMLGNDTENGVILRTHHPFARNMDEVVVVFQLPRHRIALLF